MKKTKNRLLKFPAHESSGASDDCPFARSLRGPMILPPERSPPCMKGFKSNGEVILTFSGYNF